MNRDVPAQAALLSRSARAALAAALAAAFVGSACAADAAPVPQAAASSPASIPVADFFRHPAMTSPAISPNGRYVAVLAPTRDTGFRGLMIIDLDEPAKSKLAAHFDDADIDTALWIDDEHLLITLTNARAQVDFGFFEAGFAPHTVLRDGSQLPLPAYGLGNGVVTQMRDGSGDLIIEKVHTAHVDEPDHVVPMRINLFKHTEKRLVEGAPPHVMSWTFDHQGIARVGEAIEEDKVRLYTKPAPDAPWTLVSTSSYIDNVRVLGVGPGNTIYVAARKSGQDTASLIAFDTTKTIDSSPVLVSMQGYDFDGRLVIDPDDGRLLGVKYRTDAAGVLWFDPAMKKIQARVDELLPGLINDIHCIRCGRQARMVVTSHSDRQPDLFAVYDSAKDVLMKVGASRPWIDRRMMASTELRSVTARDGLPLPVYITRPRGAKGPMPTVVLVHGGPFVRGVEWRWSRDAQFLASRGYAVIEPEFRGSQGYGFRHYKAGWKQWGLRDAG
jgi:dipeptidyl aminopeptidase/acylaminoacyl peptidase